MKGKIETRKRILGIGLTVIVLALFSLFTSSCTSKNETQVTPEDEIRSLIEEDTTGWFDFYSGLNDTLQDDSIPSVIIRPEEGDTFPFIRAWGRELVSRDGIIQIEVNGDTAYATFDFDLDGILHVAGPDTTIEKAFLDQSHREARFVHDGDPRIHGGWRLDAITFVEISTSGGTMNIDSVRVVGGEIDTTFQDPTVMFERDSLLTFPPGIPVDVYLYVDDPVNTLAFLHHWGRFRHHHRSPKFSYDPESGALKGTWITPLVPGVYHVAVDAMTWSALFVISAPYDSEAWGTPYRVAP